MPRVRHAGESGLPSGHLGLPACSLARGQPMHTRSDVCPKFNLRNKASFSIHCRQKASLGKLSFSWEKGKGFIWLFTLKKPKQNKYKHKHKTKTTPTSGQSCMGKAEQELAFIFIPS